MGQPPHALSGQGVTDPGPTILDWQPRGSLRFSVNPIGRQLMAFRHDDEGRTERFELSARGWLANARWIQTAH